MPLMDRVQKVLEAALIALLAFMVVIVFANVVLRFIFNSGIPQTEELSRYAFVWLTFLGAVVVLRESGHLGIDSFLDKLKPTSLRICRLASNTVVIACCVLMFIGSWYQTVSAVGKYSQAAQFPMVLLFCVGMVASALMAIVVVADTWRSVVRGAPAPAAPPAVQYD